MLVYARPKKLEGVKVEYKQGKRRIYAVYHYTIVDGLTGKERHIRCYSMNALQAAMAEADLQQAIAEKMKLA